MENNKTPGVLLVLGILATVVAVVAIYSLTKTQQPSQATTIILKNDSGVVLGTVSIPLTVTSKISPDPSITPGATNPNITQNNIGENICNPGWSTSSIRPPVSYTNKLKIQQIAQYGYSDTNPADYEEDHLISLELGGSPTSPLNLWPESYKSVPNAKNKDAVENYLHKEVCSGIITLQTAQHEIATGWTAVYAQIVKNAPLGSISGQGGVSVSADDQDDQ